jgi:hypothetical protein
MRSACPAEEWPVLESKTANAAQEWGHFCEGSRRRMAESSRESEAMTPRGRTMARAP